ncbi:MAG: 50S ribosomal protein L23 [gamma proteobacterium endosymbiont of Trioza apicalis]
MIHEEKLLKILYSPYNSSKSSVLFKKKKLIIFKVFKYATKKEIKYAINKIYNIKVNKVNTLIIKGKIKRNKKFFGRRVNWKKAYVFLKKNQQSNLISNSIK